MDDQRHILRVAARVATLAALLVAISVPGTARAASADTCLLNVSAAMTPVPPIATDVLDLHLEDVESGGLGLASNPAPPATTCAGTPGILRTPPVGGSGGYALDFCLEGTMWGSLMLGPDTIGFRVDVVGGHAAFDVVSVNGGPAAGGGYLAVRPSPSGGDCGVNALTSLDMTGVISYAAL